MKRKHLILSMFVIILALFFFWFFSLRNLREKKMMRIGSNIIDKVELYRSSKGYLPDSLAQVGIKENIDTELDFKYQKINQYHYYVWLGISFEESMFYYSDSKHWQKTLRGNAPNRKLPQ